MATVPDLWWRHQLAGPCRPEVGARRGLGNGTDLALQVHVLLAFLGLAELMVLTRRRKATSRGHGGPRSPGRTWGSALAGVSVLIVEDDPANAKLLSVVLEGDGAHVRIASSAEEALARIAESTPLVVVVDLVLPLMSGLVLLRQLRNDAALQDCILVAVTSFDGAEVERVVRGSGCDAFLKKPIDPLSFAQRLARLLGG
jgi:two-component system CheB/CheR fusion protein